jgi:uncharacterized coiled-coil protein SlyX
LTDDNSNLVDMDNLDNFSSTFFGTGSSPNPEPEAPKAVEEEEVPETEADALATDEDTDDEAPEGEDEDQSDGSENDEPEEEEKPEPKPKGKKSFQERINEVVAEARNAERERDALRLEIERLRNSRPEANTKPEEVEAASEFAVEGPQPDALDKDGNPKYKLGEFDPSFIRDLTRFTIEQETKAVKEAEARTAEQREMEIAQNALQSAWSEKVAAVEEELPDLREKLASVGEAFQGIDPNYGEFLAATIMSCDFGPQIMYYLSQNIGEAQKIVASGPNAATLAIGRLDAKFSKPVGNEKRNTKRVSSAPEPAKSVRGSGSRASVPADTTDLTAFEKEFFQK